jgi:hypothetical protein
LGGMGRRFGFSVVTTFLQGTLLCSGTDRKFLPDYKLSHTCHTTTTTTMAPQRVLML